MLRSKSRSRSKVRISVKKGKLSGYHIFDSEKTRRAILNKIVKKDTLNKVIKRVNVLYIYNKNKHPELARKFKKDVHYLQRTFKSSQKTKRSKKLSKKSRKRISKKLSKKSRKRISKKLSKKSKRSAKKSKRRSVKRRSKRSSRKQKGGFNYGALLNAANTAANSSLGQQLINSGKDIAKNAVSATAQHIADKTGIKIDVSDLHKMIDDHKVI